MGGGGFRGSESDLKREADVLAPLVQCWRKKWEDGKVRDAELAAAFVLAALSVRTKGRWCAGVLQSNGNDNNKTAQEQILDEGRTLGDFPGLLELLSPSYTEQWIVKAGRRGRVRDDDEESAFASGVSLLTIFSSLRLRGLKKNTNNFVNMSIAEWLRGRRPFHLLFRIPSVAQVLLMQSRGSRVVTLFTSHRALSSLQTSTLSYMAGGLEHSRDALEFLVHDLKHMELFIDPATHHEQVGFFRCLLRLSQREEEEEGEEVEEVEEERLNTVSLNENVTFFREQCKGDAQLITELYYVMADMNTSCTTLFNYLKRKWINCCCRSEECTAVFDTQFRVLLRRFGMAREDSPEALAALALCTRPLLSSEAEHLRHFFRSSSPFFSKLSPNPL